jgi:hypothetical protein
MSVSGEIQNLAKVEAGPRHQSIGKNGSFWLPKDSPDILKQNPISPKSQKNNSSSGSESTKTKQGVNHSNLKSGARESTSFEKTILSAEKKASPKTPLLQNSQMAKTNNSQSHKFVKSNLSQSPILTKIINGSTVLSKTALPFLFAKEPVKQTVLPQTVHRPISRDRGNQEQGKKDHNHGAKNAHSISSMDFKDNEVSNLASSATSAQVDSSAISKFVNFIGKSIAPRIAYTKKFSKKIVRFALDLPDGGKLGVRLEKSDKGISLCFIAPEEDIRTLLNFSKNSIKGKINSGENSEINLHVFSDYKEMDDYFIKAA